MQQHSRGWARGNWGRKCFRSKLLYVGTILLLLRTGRAKTDWQQNVLFASFPLGASTWVLASPLNNGPVLMIACFARGFAFAEKKNSRQRNKNHAALYLRSNCFKQWCRSLQQGTFGDKSFGLVSPTCRIVGEGPGSLFLPSPPGGPAHAPSLHSGVDDWIDRVNQVSFCWRWHRVWRIRNYLDQPYFVVSPSFNRPHKSFGLSFRTTAWEQERLRSRAMKTLVCFAVAIAIAIPLGEYEQII